MHDLSCSSLRAPRSPSSPANKMSTTRILWPAVLCLVTLTASVSASAESTRGRVVRVTDGDTLTVVTDTKRTIKVRLAGIDAPEKHQPFGKAAKAALSDLAYGRDVELEGAKVDREGHLVAKIQREGLDVSLELVRMGLAWWSPMRANEQSFEDREAYAAAEESAREAGRRLWSDFAAEPPWLFRAAQRALN